MGTPVLEQELVGPAEGFETFLDGTGLEFSLSSVEEIVSKQLRI